MHRDVWKLMPGEHVKSEARPNKGIYEPTMRVPLDEVPAEDYGPKTEELPPCLFKTLDRHSRESLPLHIKRMEQMADVFREQWNLASQVRMLGQLCKHAVKTGDQFQRLGVYYVTLEQLCRRLRKYAKRPEHAKEQRHWQELECRVLELLIDLDGRIQPKRATLSYEAKVKKKPPKKRGAAAGGTPTEAGETEQPTPPPRPTHELSDEELAAMIPEDER